MYENLHCIALRTIKYDDRRSIVTAWSAERGRVSLTVPDGAGREARRRRALTMPLCLFEGVADIKPGAELVGMRDVRPSAVLSDMVCNPSKALVAMFLAEVLERLLRTASPEPGLTEFVFGGALRLDAMTSARGIANFPILFMYKLGRHLGIEPDGSTIGPGRVFDMQGGRWRVTAPTDSRWLDTPEAHGAALLHRMSFEASERLALPRQWRRKALELILEYYGMHYTSLASLRSLQVAMQVF